MNHQKCINGNIHGLLIMDVNTHSKTRVCGRYRAIFVALLLLLVPASLALAGNALEINQATYEEETTTLMLSGINFGAFGQPTVSIGDSLLTSCDVSDLVISCDINGTPATGGGSFPVRISAGNSPHANAKIDVFIPKGLAACTPGDMVLCYSGAAATINVGECQTGFRICNDESIWGPCLGEVTPTSEVCDSLDNDCDGSTDEDAAGATAYFEDFDHDGYGANSSQVMACETPSQIHVIYGGDCNDNDPASNPRATEVCNLRDNDCDGQIDNNCIYPDNDHDGIKADLDCNDNNPEVRPGTTQFHVRPDERGRFDYNCDDIEEKKYQSVVEYGLFCFGAVDVQGWNGVVPDCGMPGLWVISGKLGSDFCAPNESVPSWQECR